MFYSVIETRDFSLFNQSAQALLKCYFIKSYSQVIPFKAVSHYCVSTIVLAYEKYHSYPGKR